MKFLNPMDICFQYLKNGYLSMKIKSRKIFERVECTPLFPFSRPNTYISISNKDKNESDEIGIIEDLTNLPADQQVMVKDDIEFRYFTPEIIDIKKIKAKFGIQEWKVITSKGEKTFCVKQIKENILIRENNLILLTDFNKCRYLIRDYQKLPFKARVELEQTLL